MIKLHSSQLSEESNSANAKDLPRRIYIPPTLWKVPKEAQKKLKKMMQMMFMNTRDAQQKVQDGSGDFVS